MFRSCILLAVVAVITPAGRAAGGPDEVSFEGYSREAEQIIARMSSSLRRITSYIDDGVIRVESDAAFMGQQPDRPASLAYWRPNRFVARTTLAEMACDGQELTITMRQLQRFKKMPVKQNLAAQLSPYWESSGFPLTMARMILSNDPDRLFARMFTQLEVSGKVRIDGVPCIVLQGFTQMPVMPVSGDMPVTLWLREKDAVLRMIEVDITAAVVESMADAPAGAQTFERMAYVYDCRNQRINERLSADDLQYDPPAGDKEVEAFHSPWMHTAKGAAQFPLSGKPFPEVELQTIDGESVNPTSWREQVTVVSFLPSFNGAIQFVPDRISKVAERFRGKPVKVIVVVAGSLSAKSAERMQKLGSDVQVLTDNDGDLAESFDTLQTMSTVLVDAKGVIQGRYTGPLTPRTVKLVSADLETLLGGKQLPSAAEMTSEQVTEAEEQISTVYSSGESQVESLNQDWLVERWSVRAKTQMSYVPGQPPRSTDQGFWIRNRHTLQHVSIHGEITSEIRVNGLPMNQYGQDGWVVGQIGRTPGVVYASPLLGEADDDSSPSMRGVRLTAYDHQGGEVWRLELDGPQYRMPQSMALAELDGRPGDELVFLFVQTLYVVDSQGRVVVRWNNDQYTGWIVAEDRDGDGRAEIYLRTPDKLRRLDYRPG